MGDLLRVEPSSCGGCLGPPALDSVRDFNPLAQSIGCVRHHSKVWWLGKLEDYYEERYRERVLRQLSQRAQKFGMQLVAAEQPA